eukprot:TRINITY_DN39937_c0_g1_i1.p1 TRINITY_DN39937_c0_g1~~TRINITY_DN39937_c0_g1_i1.p1  ORF type:complete len:206 (-),score=45.55 TRINITY_DN39937_c0_g1_i1:3-620(-)
MQAAGTAKLRADKGQIHRLASKIGHTCRDESGDGKCVVGAMGEIPIANAFRALAEASELGKSPVEVRVRWEEEEGDERSLRFHTELRQNYNWKAFKERWSGLRQKPAVLTVTPHTNVHRLGTALVTEQKKKGGVAIKLSHSSDYVLAIAAKALATMPHLAQTERLGGALVCVLRWPRLRESLVQEDVDNKFIYAHILERVSETPE